MIQRLCCKKNVVKNINHWVVTNGVNLKPSRLSSAPYFNLKKSYATILRAFQGSARLCAALAGAVLSALWTIIYIADF
jgi:hypothetical protein